VWLCRSSAEYVQSTTTAAAGSSASSGVRVGVYAGERDVWRTYDGHRAYVSARCTTALRRAAGQLAAR
jgi:hypothetical protein